MKTKLNIKKISELTSVAPSTVSRILSGKARQHRISPKTEKRVLEIAEKLGFRPNYFAHSLNTGKTHTIGLVFANTVDTFLGGIMEGVEAFLRDTEYQMVVATCENDPELEKKEIERMRYRQVDGIILYPSAATADKRYDTSHLVHSDERSIPYVVIGRKIDFPADHILFSDYEAGAEAAESFIKKGYETFAVVTTRLKCSANKERIRGFLEYLEKQGIQKRNIEVVKGDPSPGQLEKLKTIDCFWGVNTAILLNLATILSSSRDVAKIPLCSVGEPEFPHLLKLDLQIFRMPAKKMGIMAAERLLAKIDDPNLSTIVQHVPWA